MTYDYMGRRVRKLVLELVDGEGPPTGSNPWGGNDGEVVDDMRYIYDGWNVVIERRVTDRTTVGEYPETAVRKYAWGLDLSGLNGAAASGNVQSAIHGAGGIGGLLAIEDFTTQIGYENSRACIYFYDGNGNVGQLVTWKTGDPELVEEPGQLPWTPFNLPGRVAERYEYDPYGGTLLADDDYAVDNPFRFSTKYYDAQPSTASAGERGLLYFGERYYSPRLGRWVNRDPIGESDGNNIYSFVGNSVDNTVDVLGLFRPGLATLAYLLIKSASACDCPDSDAAALQEYLNAVQCETGMPNSFGVDYVYKTTSTQQRLTYHQPGLDYSGVLPPPTCTTVCHNPPVMRAFMAGEPSGDFVGDEIYWASFYQRIGQYAIEDMREYDDRCQAQSVWTLAACSAISSRCSPRPLLDGCGELSRGAMYSRHGFSIRNVNPLQGSSNCGQCAIATDATLKGNPACALNLGPVYFDEIEKSMGRHFIKKYHECVRVEQCNDKRRGKLKGDCVWVA